MSGMNVMAVCDRNVTGCGQWVELTCMRVEWIVGGLAADTKRDSGWSGQWVGDTWLEKKNSYLLDVFITIKRGWTDIPERQVIQFKMADRQPVGLQQNVLSVLQSWRNNLIFKIVKFNNCFNIFFHTVGRHVLNRVWLFSTWFDYFRTQPFLDWG